MVLLRSPVAERGCVVRGTATDIGGYKKGDTNSSDFRQLIVRWFEFGFTSPLFRQHGKRVTEIWLFGDEACALITEIIALRYKFAPYILAELAYTSQTGRPFNTPLWFDFGDDPQSWNESSSYMFGRDFLAAPVVQANATEKQLYLPRLSTAEASATGTARAQWRHYFSGKLFGSGGHNVTVAAPLGSLPLFQRTDRPGLDAFTATRRMVD